MTSLNQYCKAIKLNPSTKLENLFVFSLLIFISLLFIIFPNIDLEIADVFYTTQGWYLNTYWAFILKHAISVMSAIFIIGAGILCTSLRLKNEYKTKVRFLFLAMLIGPGLFVNFGFKDHWGRARPGQLVQFGGEKYYTAPLQRSNECKKNCSFVSGHAAMGYSLIFLAAITESRLIWLMGGVTAGLLIGLLRMLQGGHFLSDVLFAFFPVWISMELIILFMWIVYRFKERQTKLL